MIFHSWKQHGSNIIVQDRWIWSQRSLGHERFLRQLCIVYEWKSGFGEIPVVLRSYHILSCLDYNLACRQTSVGHPKETLRCNEQLTTFPIPNLSSQYKSLPSAGVILAARRSATCTGLFDLGSDLLVGSVGVVGLRSQSDYPLIFFLGPNELGILVSVLGQIFVRRDPRRSSNEWGISLVSSGDWPWAVRRISF